jgi:hypothetical protein
MSLKVRSAGPFNIFEHLCFEDVWQGPSLEEF